MNLPDALYTAAQVRELDRVAIEEEGIAGLTLMRRAARACVEDLEASWPDARSVAVFCGSGNNAGDGYIVAGMLAERGCHVQVIVVGDPEKLGDDARRGREYCQTAGADLKTFDDAMDSRQVKGEVIVDALLGTGLSGEVRSRYRQAIDVINAGGLPVLSVDIPSGLSADTGMRLGTAVRATRTVTFIGIKRGLLTGEGPDLTGALAFARLEVPERVYERVPVDTIRLDYDRNVPALAPRPRGAHKGNFGHVLIVGGDAGMGGAVAMAGEAALRTGAGLVSIATHPDHAGSLIPRRPELMTRGVDTAADLTPLLARASTIVLGPGLGTSDWSRQMFDAVLDLDLPTVIDADGLNLLAGSGRQRDNWILTPHPGEASRLLTESSADRFATVRRLQELYGGVVLLKGVGSLIADGTRTLLCPYGNPGMATAGMGDILSGIAGGLLAQGLTPSDALALAVVVHARAADILAAREGQRGMVATDLIPVVRQLLNEPR